MTARFWRYKLPRVPLVSYAVNGMKLFGSPDRQTIRSAMRVGRYPIQYGSR